MSELNPRRRVLLNPDPKPYSKQKNAQSLLSHLQQDSVIISALERLRSQSQSSSPSSETLTLADLDLRKKDQVQSDAVLDEEKGDYFWGVVLGRLIFTEDGKRMDCTKMGSGGKFIPRNVDYSVKNIESDALFILLVEDDDVFMRLECDLFYNRFPCIIITSKGHPEGATGIFLRRLNMELKLPVFALLDSDPYGLKILSVYMYGSDSTNLTTLDIKWLGLRPSDLDKYQISESCRFPMRDQDMKAVKDLLEEDFVKRNKGWVMELELMVKMRQKAEVLALSSLGIQYLTKVYLPLKLQQQDWL